MTKEDIKRFMIYLEGMVLTRHTKYMPMIMVLLLVYDNNEYYPKHVVLLKHTLSKNKRKRRELTLLQLLSNREG